MYTNTIKSPSTVTITVEGDLISNLFSFNLSFFIFRNPSDRIFLSLLRLRGTQS